MSKLFEILLEINCDNFGSIDFILVNFHPVLDESGLKCWGPTIPPQSSLVWLNQIASHVLCWGLWQRFRMKKPVIWFRFQMFWVLVEGFGILPKKMAFKVRRRLLEGPAGNFRISSEIVHWLQWPWNNR